MRTRKEIEAYLRALEWGLRQPCDCAARGLACVCEPGARIIEVSMDVLWWVLEQHPEYHVKLVQPALAQHRRAQRDGGHETR